MNAIDRPVRSWILGVIGGMAPGKGQKDAIYTTSQLINARAENRLACIGLGNEEDLLRLQKTANYLGIRESGMFIENQKNRVEIYDLVDVVAITSRAEAFGKVPFEATYASLLVVYSKGA